MELTFTTLEPATVETMVSISRDRFEQLVADALDSIPTELGNKMANVAVMVEDQGDTANLLGLYQGVPLTKRGSYSGAFPDRITIYQDPICRRCETEEQVAAAVRRTVIHEVGHHFGISDERLRELGW
jgi:predicted Zn-dependent protease with MMP-like domain